MGLAEAFLGTQECCRNAALTDLLEQGGTAL
jgi:hypothetical protein